MPDVAVLVDAFITTDFDSPAVRQALLVDAAAEALAPAGGGGGAGGPRGAKRELDDGGDGGIGGAGGVGGGARDAYRMRLKQRARMGGE